MSKGLYLGAKDLSLYLGAKRSEVKAFLMDCGLTTASGKPTARTLAKWPRVVIGTRPKWFAPFVGACWRRDGREVPDGAMERVRSAREERQARAANRAPRREPTEEELMAMAERLRLRAVEHALAYPTFHLERFLDWIDGKPASWIRWAHGRKISSLNRARRNEEKAVAMAD